MKTERRRGPGAITLLSVLVIIGLQAALFFGFQVVKEKEVGIVPENLIIDQPELPVKVVTEEVSLPPPRDVESLDATREEEELAALLTSMNERPDVAQDSVPVDELLQVAVAKDDDQPAETTRVMETEGPAVYEWEPPQPIQEQSVTRLPRPEYVRLVSVSPQRFAADEQSDEKRILNIRAAIMPGQRNVRGGNVSVEVTFYDEVGNSGMAVPSRVKTTSSPIHLKKRKWKPGATYLVSATYLVPKGYRARYKEETGTSLRFYGYVVRLYYNGVLQDATAQPERLLHYMRE